MLAIRQSNSTTFWPVVDLPSDRNWRLRESRPGFCVGLQILADFRRESTKIRDLNRILPLATKRFNEIRMKMIRIVLPLTRLAC